MRDDVAAATITWARSPEEEIALRQSLSVLAATGLPISVADRGTSAAFATFLEGLPNVRVTTPREHGLTAQVRASIDLAAHDRCPLILYVEPDKELFFRRGLRPFIERALQHHHEGVVMAARSDESFATYPAMQRYTESVVNHLCGEMMARHGDYSYGPFLMSRHLLPHVASLSAGMGWGWRPSVFVTAHRSGLEVRHVIGDYPCPLSQRVEDEAERKHRMRQLSENILGLLA
jgi:hypothetical protein